MFANQVKKETQKLREFEEGLVSQYKFYLENLEQTVKGKSLCVSFLSYATLFFIYYIMTVLKVSFSFFCYSTLNIPYLSLFFMC